MSRQDASGETVYKMSTFTELTGFSPELLRAWERRHGLLEPRRSVGGHRVYTESDRLVIQRVRALLDQGRSIGEIAQLGRARLLEDAQNAGKVLGAPPAPDAVRARIMDAAKRLDERALQRALDDAFAFASPLTVVEQIVVPVAREVGELWHMGAVSVASEHLLTGALVYRVQKLIELSLSPSRVEAPVICACFPGETHELGLLIIALYLVAAGRRVSYLGQSLPAEDLDQAIATLRPRAVCLSVSLPKSYEAHKRAVAALARKHKGEVAFVVGGPGCPERDPMMARASVALWPLSRPLAGFAEAVPS